VNTIFVQIKCELGAAYDVADRIVECVEEASEIYSTSGEYDLMLKCYLDDGADIGHFVTERIQRLRGIKGTFTTVAFKAFPVAGSRGG
jgi:DNA-binding Lrp family transcriptional regulator